MGQQIPKTFQKRFYFFDCEGIGGLYYENSTGSIEFIGDSGQLLKISTGLIKKEDLPLRLAVSYHSEKGCFLYYGYRGKKAEYLKKWMPNHYVGNEKAHVGSDRTGHNQINGLIYAFSSFPTYLTETGCNNILNRKVAVNPWERLSLENVIRDLYGYRLIRKRDLQSNQTKLDIYEGTIVFSINAGKLKYDDGNAIILFDQTLYNGSIVIAKDHDNKLKFMHVVHGMGRTAIEHDVSSLNSDERYHFAMTWSVKNKKLHLYINGKNIAAAEIKYSTPEPTA